MKLYNWEQMPEEHVHELFSRRFISGEQMTMARIFLKKGCLVPTHNHESEQLTTRIKNRFAEFPQDNWFAWRPPLTQSTHSLW